MEKKPGTKKKTANDEDARVKKKFASEEFQNKQIKIVLVLIGILFLAGILSYYIYQQVSNPEYRGLKFYKVKEGKIDFYVVRVPSINPLTGQAEGYYDMALRNNPNDLNYINFTGRAKFLRNITLSFSRAIEGCSDNLIAVANFVRVFNGGLGFNIKGATTNEEYARDVNMTYATCDHAGNQTVIIIQNASLGGPTAIEETIDDCYVIDVDKCEVLPALERFMLETAAR